MLVGSVLAMWVSFAQASTITVTWPEVNGPQSPSSFPFTIDAGTMTFTLPPTEVITGAVFSSTFGNTIVDRTAVIKDVLSTRCLRGACLRLYMHIRY